MWARFLFIHHVKFSAKIVEKELHHTLVQWKILQSTQPFQCGLVFVIHIREYVIETKLVSTFVVRSVNIKFIVFVPSKGRVLPQLASFSSGSVRHVPPATHASRKVTLLRHVSAPAGYHPKWRHTRNATKLYERSRGHDHGLRDRCIPDSFEWNEFVC